jgi:cell division protein ZapA (FtsZ GTPase activity inhibitor)
MQKTIKVIIGEREYSLRGEDIDLIKSAATEVNSQLEILKGKTNEPVSNLSLMAALNIAEKYYSVQKQSEIDLSFLTTELESMAAYLKKPVESIPMNT